MTQASDREAAEKEHRDRLRDSNHEEYCNPSCFEDGWDAGIAHARREMEGEIKELKAALKSCCYCDDPAYRSIEPCSACDVLNKYGSKE